MKFNIINTYTSSLASDPSLENYPRQVLNSCYSFVTPKIPSTPKLIHYSSELAADCGITIDELESVEMLKILSGTKVLENTSPFAMCYGGHQFGHWAGQLGDGRAINLFEHTFNGNQFSFQLKGAGPTPYSRSADGLAVLRSSIREYICSEAMYNLGIQTTRALSLITTGDPVWRDIMYDGHPNYESGAIVCRVAPSFIRFGSFEIFASRNDINNLKLLTDYTIAHFYPHIRNQDKQGYLQFFQEVTNKTLEMIIDWQRVGFVHGVMNTDNMSILGLTIDYGPYGWVEDYDPSWTPNTTDSQFKRYRFENQPNIGLWNLSQLANAILPLIDDIPALEEILDSYHQNWMEKFYQMNCNKLGIHYKNDNSVDLIKALDNCMQLIEIDRTIFYRNLSNIQKTMSIEDLFNVIQSSFYNPELISDSIQKEWNEWLIAYRNYLVQDKISDKDRKIEMNTVNPKYIFRNYMAHMTIELAEKEDYSLLNELFNVLKKPYDEQPEYEKWFSKRPEWAKTKVGCSMLSCSS